LVLVVWEVGRATHLVNPKLFPSFAAVCKAFVQFLKDGTLMAHMYASFVRVLIGFSLGIVAAVILGFLIGWFRVIRLIVDPLVSFFRALPPIALIPLMIIFFGIGETSKIIVLTYASFFPALVVIYQALIGLEPIYGRAAQTLGLTTGRCSTKSYSPNSIPISSPPAGFHWVFAGPRWSRPN
jgi:NitT/TauT family transport system permease protein